MKRKILAALLAAATLQAAGFVDETSEMESSTNRDMKTVKDLRSVQRAFNTSDPRDNVVVVKWSPEITTKLRLRTMVETLVVLPPDEEIVSFPSGDTHAFRVSPMITKNYNTKNMFTVRPEFSGADTNLAVVGSSGRIYNFYLRADSIDSPFLPVFTCYVTLDGRIEPLNVQGATESEAAEKSNITTKNTLNHFISKNLDMQTLNFSYASLTGGSQELRPDAVFDDGDWTYFLFEKKPGKPQRFPVVYQVLDRHDTPTNSRIEGDFLIVETISDQWTLRAGTAHKCIARIKK
jgi:type IV secretory pathway VirB9-like protein